MGNAGEKENAPHNVRCASWERQELSSQTLGQLRGEIAWEFSDSHFAAQNRNSPVALQDKNKPAINAGKKIANPAKVEFATCLGCNPWLY